MISLRTEAPLVSVVMPAYNAEAYIKMAIGSVLSQTMPDLELLVVEDGSSDSTAQIVGEMAKSDERIRLIYNKQNMGTAKTRNRGMELSRGRYVALLDSDDLWHPTKLEKQLALMEREKVDLCYCSYAMITENGQTMCDDFVVSPQVDLDSMLKKSEIGCSTVIMTRELADTYRFDRKFYHEDYALWLTMLRDGRRAAGVTEVLVDYRVRCSSRASNKLAGAKRRWVIYRELMELSVWRSGWYSVQYAVSGLRKYRKAK